jgi:integrase
MGNGELDTGQCLAVGKSPGTSVARSTPNAGSQSSRAESIEGIGRPPNWVGSRSTSGSSKKTLKGRTYTSYESVWRTLVKPRWGDTRLDRVTHGEAVRWVAELTERGLSPSRITQALLCLKQVLALAVMDGRLARNAAEHVKPPRPRKAEPRFLTHEQVHELAEACGHYRVFVLTAAYTGLRWGELRALRVKRIDLERGRIDVAEAMPERSLELDTPKNHKRRTVPIPGFVVNELEKHVQGKGPDDLVFTNSARGMLDNTNFRRNIWNPAARSISLEGFTPHDLRHTTVRWRSVRERTSRLCSDCSAMRQRR